VLPQPASRHALSILRFPDRRTAWVVLLAVSADVPADLGGRIEALHEVVPVVGARLRDEVWHQGAPPTTTTTDDDPLHDPVHRRPFHLHAEPPLRIVASAKAGRLLLAGHHAAFDGRALVAVLACLLDGVPPAFVTSPPPGADVDPPWAALRRLVRPAHRVAPSRPAPVEDSIVTRRFEPRGGGTTATLAAACAAAVAATSPVRGRRIGITLAVGGPPGIGNVASYRRIDVRPADDVAAVAAAELARPVEPVEQVRSPRAMRLLAPVANRFADTILVSNLGRSEVAGARELAFLPVARGRSAVAVGAAGLANGPSTLSLRARDLAPADAERLLDRVLLEYEQRR
jgi:hypothetical protein